MIRTLALLVAAGMLVSCQQHREPRANCFSLVSRGPASMDCIFEPLDDPGHLGGHRG